MPIYFLFYEEKQKYFIMSDDRISFSGKEDFDFER